MGSGISRSGSKANPKAAATGSDQIARRNGQTAASDSTIAEAQREAMANSRPAKRAKASTAEAVPRTGTGRAKPPRTAPELSRARTPIAPRRADRINAPSTLILTDPVGGGHQRGRAAATVGGPRREQTPTNNQYRAIWRSQQQDAGERGSVHAPKRRRKIKPGRRCSLACQEQSIRKTGLSKGRRRIRTVPDSMKSVLKSKSAKRAGTIRQARIPEVGSHGKGVPSTAPTKGAHLRNRREGGTPKEKVTGKNSVKTGVMISPNERIGLVRGDRDFQNTIHVFRRQAGRELGVIPAGLPWNHELPATKGNLLIVRRAPSKSDGGEAPPNDRDTDGPGYQCSGSNKTRPKGGPWRNEALSMSLEF
ncbi:hypothetical protein GQ457_16G017880 [Hibiscus cannabinus]